VPERTAHLWTSLARGRLIRPTTTMSDAKAMDAVGSIYPPGARVGRRLIANVADYEPTFRAIPDLDSTAKALAMLPFAGTTLVDHLDHQLAQRRLVLSKFLSGSTSIGKEARGKPET